MKIAIDIDGVITNNPKFFSNFIRNQTRGGNEIFILTSRLINDETKTDKNRVLQLSKMQITEYAKLVSIVRDKQYPDCGIGKGEFCRDNDIDLIIEDDKNYLTEIKRISPKTQGFLIYI